MNLTHSPTSRLDTSALHVLCSPGKRGAGGPCGETLSDKLGAFVQRSLETKTCEYNYKLTSFICWGTWGHLWSLARVFKRKTGHAEQLNSQASETSAMFGGLEKKDKYFLSVKHSHIFFWL